jgi:endonuclease YncB( thermonuclease family)
MAYTLIKGEFHIHYPDIPRQGPEPDGDTLKFLPDDRSLVEGLLQPHRPPNFNGRNMINLRFEGIDALETHFSGMHQHEKLAEKARDQLLEKAGFGQIKFWDDLPHKVEAVQHHPRRGHILARSLDTFGRVLAFVYPGNTPRADGSNVTLDVPLLNQSFNAKLISSGIAYPAFYTSLPVELKDRLTNLTIQAWNMDRGLWPSDTANVEYWEKIPDLATLQELAIWPKLFRRLAKYFDDLNEGLGQFDAWLRDDPRDRDDRVLLSNGEIGNMHDIIDIDGNWIRMNEWPEDIVILPDDA